MDTETKELAGYSILAVEILLELVEIELLLEDPMDSELSEEDEEDDSDDTLEAEL